MRSPLLYQAGRWIFHAVALAMIVGLSISASAADFPLAWGTTESTEDGSSVQSASGVVQTLYDLALEADYTHEEAETLASTVRTLIGDGIPPGTLLQVSRKLLLDLSAPELVSSLAELGERIADGEAPGQVANEILDRGSARNGETEGDDDGNNGNGKGIGKNKEPEDEEASGEDDATAEDPDHDAEDEDADGSEDDDTDDDDEAKTVGNGKTKGKGKKK